MSDIYFKFNTPPCSTCHVEMKFNSIFSTCNICDRTYIIFNTLHKKGSYIKAVNEKKDFCFNRKAQPKGRFCDKCGVDPKVLKAFEEFQKQNKTE